MNPTEITSAAQLHAALTAPDADTRLGTLEAVVADPKAALGFGLYADRDINDVLLEQARSTPVAAEWLTLVNALRVFADPRVAEFFTDVLAEHPDPAILCLASDYLAATRAKLPRARVEELVLQNDCAARARAAAPLLVGMGVRTSPGRLRVALLVDDGVPPPFADAPDAYAAELRGPFVQEARATLTLHGEAAASWLLTCWASLDDATLAWLVDWAVQTLPAGAAEATVGRVLDSGNDELVRIALIRLAEREDALGDAHWQVRAAAVDGLVALGFDICPAVRPLVDDARLPVRVAAVDVLLRLGEDAWLAEHLLGAVEGAAGGGYARSLADDVSPASSIEQRTTESR